MWTNQREKPGKVIHPKCCKYLKKNFSAQPFRQIRNGLVSGRSAWTSRKSNHLNNILSAHRYKLRLKDFPGRVSFSLGFCGRSRTTKKAKRKRRSPWKVFTAACIFFTPFFTSVYIVEQLVSDTIYVLKKEILQFLGLNSAVSNQERVIMAHER